MEDPEVPPPPPKNSKPSHVSPRTTAIIRAYDEVRDALAFLRRKHDDVDELVPSLYAARNGRRKRSEAENEDNGPAQAGSAPRRSAMQTAPSSAPDFRARSSFRVITSGIERGLA